MDTMPDAPLKSAFELAMDRLKAKDREEGVPEEAPLTEAQKARITEIRRDAKAKLAEMEILHRKNLAGTGGDPAAVAKIEETYAIDRGRVESRMESAIAKARRGEG
jgi:Spy/CpxP family protein refolding chaperone